MATVVLRRGPPFGRGQVVRRHSASWGNIFRTGLRRWGGAAWGTPVRACSTRIPRSSTSLLSRLHLQPGASAEEIRVAFRKLAMQHHPDTGGDPALFRDIKEAYEELMAAHGESGAARTGRDPRANLRIHVRDHNFTAAWRVWRGIESSQRTLDRGDADLLVLLASRDLGTPLETSFSLIYALMGADRFTASAQTAALNGILHMCHERDAPMDFVLDRVLPVIDELNVEKDEDTLAALNSIFRYFGGVG